MPIQCLINAHNFHQPDHSDHFDWSKELLGRTMQNPHCLFCLVCCLFALLQTVFFVFWKQHCMTPHNFHNNARWDYILKTSHFSTFSPLFKSQEWVPHWQNNEFGTCRGAAAGVEKGKYPGARTRFCCQMPKATTAMSCSEKRCYYQYTAEML